MAADKTFNHETHELHETIAAKERKERKVASRCLATNIPVFATAAPVAILAPMPMTENNAMLYRQTALRNQLRRTRDLLLPRLLSEQVNLTGTEP